MLQNRITGALPASDLKVEVYRVEADDHIFVPERYDTVNADHDYDYAEISGVCKHGNSFSQQIYPPNDSWKSLTPEGLRDYLKKKLKEEMTYDLSCGICDHPPCCQHAHQN